MRGVTWRTALPTCSYLLESGDVGDPSLGSWPGTTGGSPASSTVTRGNRLPGWVLVGDDALPGPCLADDRRWRFSCAMRSHAPRGAHAIIPNHGQASRPRHQTNPAPRLSDTQRSISRTGTAPVPWCATAVAARRSARGVPGGSRDIGRGRRRGRWRQRCPPGTFQPSPDMRPASPRIARGSVPHLGSPTAVGWSPSADRPRRFQHVGTSQTRLRGLPSRPVGAPPLLVCALSVRGLTVGRVPGTAG